MKLTLTHSTQPPDHEPGESGRWTTVWSALDSWGRTARLIVILLVLALTSAEVIYLLVWLVWELLKR